MLTENQKDDVIDTLIVIKKIGVEGKELSDLDRETLKRNHSLLVKLLLKDHIRYNKGE